jgi:hypothetical protein
MIGRPKKTEDTKAKPNDRVTCDICKGTFTRGNRSAHKKTRYHQAFHKTAEFIKKTLIDSEPNKKDTFDDRIKEAYEDPNGGIIYLTKRQYNFYKRLGKEKYDYKKI